MEHTRTDPERSKRRAFRAGLLLRSLQRRTTDRDRIEIASLVFCDGRGEFRAYVYRLTWLSALSTLIAGFGLIASSPAVVIGAMLVAPLMQPIIGFSAGLTLGNGRRELVSLLLIGYVTAVSAGVAMLLGLVVPWFRVITLTPELVARTSPALLDLGIAVAAGAAGAYVTVRPRAGGAIAGAAIAVALVPPLAAFGILFVRGNGHLAIGALLLFLTNLVGIVIAAVVVFFLTGFVAHEDTGRWRHAAIALPLVALLAVAYPLGQRSITNLHRSGDEARIRDLVLPELRASGLGIQSLVVLRKDGTTIASLDVAGPSEPPDTALLADEVAAALGRRVRLIVRWTKREEFSAETGGAGRRARPGPMS